MHLVRHLHDKYVFLLLEGSSMEGSLFIAIDG